MTSPAGGAVSTGPLNVSQCEQVTVWFSASGAAAPTNCMVSLCDANGAQILSKSITVAIAGSSPAFAGEGPAPGVTNAVALGPVPPVIFASGSGGAASTLRIVVLGLPRATFQPIDYPTPIIPEDANTVAHVWWKDGTGLVDAKGNSWTMNGTVPQIARTIGAPSGAGPFSDANYYALGSGNDVLDFAGDFSCCFVITRTVIDATRRIIASDGLDSTSGWYIDTYATSGVVSIVFGAPATRTIIGPTANALGTNAPNVICAGRAATTGYVKLNLGTLVTAAAGTITPATTVIANLGRYGGGALPDTDGAIMEAWLSTTTPSDALF